MAGASTPIATGVASVPEEEFGGEKRELRGGTAALCRWACVGFTAFHLAVLNVFPLDAYLYRAIHVAWGSALGFLLFRAFKSERKTFVPWYDWILIAGAIGCAVYIGVEIDSIQFRAGAIFTVGDVGLGIVGTVLLLEFTRRTSGIALPIIAGAFILYAFAGPWMPGVLEHRGFSPARFFSYIYSDLGVLGITTQVSSTYIILFVAFAAFLQVSRAGDYFNDLAVALCGWARGGPAKVAVVSGVLFGTISGSAVGNVVASGMITIPMMRRVGYDRSTAAAVEATSSTGGQITPPVMGAGAFIMAEITGIPYGEIALAAVLPAILFYVACYAHVDLHALKFNLKGIPRAELPALGLLLRKFYLFAPIFVLVGAMVIGYSPFRAGMLGIVAAVVASWLSRSERVGPKKILEGLERAAHDMIQLVAVCACAGIVVGVIALTGIGGRFAAILSSIAQGNQLLAMIFAMLVALILGMGMPTTAAYAIAASVVAPGLIRSGVPVLVAHMFIFYYAVISAITPPVALASFAAAGMARADPWKTSWISLKLGLATFIVPFMFFYSPLLLLKGDWASVTQAAATAILGVVLLACASEGWFRGRLEGSLGWALRAILFGTALMLILPEPVVDIAALAAAVLVYALQWWRAKRAIA
jgi:TRAP transporter 4TM/12TM fusion protein